MAQLFERPIGPIRKESMLFHLADLPEQLLKNYTNLIEKNGGKVKLQPEENVLTFTEPKSCFKYKFVFSVKFFDACVASGKFVNLNEYYIGDTRLTPECGTLKSEANKENCLWRYIGNAKSLPTSDESDKAKINSLVNKSIDLEKSLENEANSPSTIISDSDSEEIDDSCSEKLKPKVELSVSDRCLHFEVSSADDSNLDESSGSSSSYSPPKYCNRQPKKKYNLRSKSKNINPERYGKLPITNVAYHTVKTEDEDPQPSMTRSSNQSHKGKSLSLRNKNIKPVKSKKLPTIDLTDLDVKLEDGDDDDYQQLSAEKDFRQLDAEKSFKDLTEWRDKQLINRKKDDQGFPVNDLCVKGKNNKVFIKWEQWEKDIIVNFLIESNNIFFGKGSSPWQLAKNLKILPQIRGKYSMQYVFVDHILPNIENFILPPEIEEKFVNYRTFGSIVNEMPINELKQWAKKVTKSLPKDKNGYPKGDDIDFQIWEKRMIIDFIVAANLIKLYLDSRLWEVACKLKIFPAHRTKQTLHCEFKFNIMPNIEFFNLPFELEKQFLRLRLMNRYKSPPEELLEWAKEETKDLNKDQFGLPLATGRKTPKCEEKRMIKYIIKTNKFKEAFLPSTWEQAINLKLFSNFRTAVTLIPKLRYHILPRIEEFHLPKDIEEKFIILRNTRSNIRIPSEEMKQWAEEVSKDRKKDNYGYPQWTSDQFEEWEHKLMIEFLIKWNLIEKCTALNIWQLVYNLKIFPKKRVGSHLLREFSDNILPVIENFKLSEEAKKKFFKSKSFSRNAKNCLELSDDLKRWAAKVSEGRKKDTSGFPVGEKNIAKWEKELMVDFLIKANRIHLGKSVPTWKMAVVLKIFPKSRTFNGLRVGFQYFVLPHIEDFNLPQEIEQEFKKLQKK